MMHGTAPTNAFGYHVASFITLMQRNRVNTLLMRLSGDPRPMAGQHKQVQETEEQTRLGIPVSISSDPRNHFQRTAGGEHVGRQFLAVARGARAGRRQRPGACLAVW